MLHGFPLGLQQGSRAQRVIQNSEFPCSLGRLREVKPQKLLVEERLRFTGQAPPPGLLERYPNWQNAYEEEGMPEQDETTLRPADNQSTIDDIVSCTAGDAIFASGQRLPALLVVLCGELAVVNV